MAIYENIFILNPDLNDDEVKATVEKIEGLIKENSGEMIDVEQWGKKKLAYEVNKERYGYYFLTHFEGDAKLISELERNFKLIGDVMKYIIIRLKKNELAKWESSKKEKKVEEKTDS